MGFSLSSLDPTSKKNLDSLGDDLVKGAKIGATLMTFGSSDLLGFGIIDDELDYQAGQEKKAANLEKDLLEKQEELRVVDFAKAGQDQKDAEVLAQRTVFREQQANARAQQAGQASIANIASQSSFKSSALQSASSSLGTQVDTAQSDLLADSTRLSESLASNLDYLQTTFDLGGEINNASQSLANQRQAMAENSAATAGLLSGAATGASVGAIAGPGGAVIGAGVGALLSLF